MNQLIHKYNDSSITFKQDDGDVMVNATQMAKEFGKRPSKWLELPSTKEFLTELQTIRLSDSLIKTAEGRNGGTWFHEDVALEFARWLSPRFSIWCNDKIKELLKTGSTQLDFTDPNAVVILAQNWANEQNKRIALEKENAKLKPKAELMDKVLDTDEKIDIGQATKILELPFGRNTMFKKLREKGIFFKARNEPKQEYIKRKYFVLKERYIERNNHDGFVVVKVLVTQKGLEFLSNLFNSQPSKKEQALIG